MVTHQKWLSEDVIFACRPNGFSVSEVTCWFLQTVANKRDPTSMTRRFAGFLAEQYTPSSDEVLGAPCGWYFIWTLRFMPEKWPYLAKSVQERAQQLRNQRYESVLWHAELGHQQWSLFPRPALPAESNCVAAVNKGLQWSHSVFSRPLWCSCDLLLHTYISSTAFSCSSLEIFSLISGSESDLCSEMRNRAMSRISWSWFGFFSFSCPVLNPPYFSNRWKNLPITHVLSSRVANNESVG